MDDPVFPNSPIFCGDVQDVPALDSEQSPVQRKEERAVEGQEIGASTENEVRFFSCPVEGCVSTFQRHSNLERHLHYEKCKFVKEKHTLLDKAKMAYTEKLQEGSMLSEQSGEVQPQGWALRSTKKATRFNAKQKGYLDEKFRIGEQSGHKADPAQVAKDMRHAKHEDGNRRFTVDEFLTPQQI